MNPTNPSPAPWKRLAGGRIVSTALVPPGNIVVHEGAVTGRTADETAANESLIERAPELLAAVQAAKDVMFDLVGLPMPAELLGRLGAAYGLAHLATHPKTTFVPKI